MCESIISAMLTASRGASPLEACGILLGNGAHIHRFVETTNVHPSPEAHFEIDPQALIDAHRTARKGGAQVVGYFHSHPRGNAVPSATDQHRSARDGRIWAIAAEGAVRFWEDACDGFQPLSYVAQRG